MLIADDPYFPVNAPPLQFPDVPILGLTATSTSAVTKDVKDILRIPQVLPCSGLYMWPSGIEAGQPVMFVGSPIALGQLARDGALKSASLPRMFTEDRQANNSPVRQALLFMSDFNRPNLHYSVRLKPETQEQQLALLAKMVNTIHHILTTGQQNRTHSHHRTTEQNSFSPHHNRTEHILTTPQHNRTQSHHRTNEQHIISQQKN